MKAKVNKVTIEIIQGDIFALEVDGIIISSTPSLTLPQEILDYVGEGVQSEATQIGTCDVGSAVVTSAGNISHANKLIHTVGRDGEKVVNVANYRTLPGVRYFLLKKQNLNLSQFPRFQSAR